MKRILIICGPTATGKTDLGISLAKRFNGEIVSVDSRQVYKGMDIGTGKDLPKLSSFKLQSSIKNKDMGYYLFDNIPVWLLDMVNPDYKFSVADYVECAHWVINDIQKRGKLPVVAGGTGFYIKGAVDGIDTLGITPDWDLRQKLSHLGVEELQGELKKLDTQKLKGMNESDRNNPRRLIRAIEISLSTPLNHPNHPNHHDTLFVGLTTSYKTLYQRIDKRVDVRAKEGAEEEIKKLLKHGYNWDNSALGRTIGYKEWQSYFEDKTSGDETVKAWKFAEHGYARRQMTWFKKDKRIQWFDISQAGWQEKLAKLVQKWYHQDNYADKS